MRGACEKTVSKNNKRFFAVEEKPPLEGCINKKLKQKNKRR